MQEQPVVTVALPAWNASATIGLAVRSMLSQTFTGFELLVLDDGSVDGTPDIVSSFGDSRIRLVCDGQRRGLATRLNQALDLARGRYFARMDADDVSFPERLGRQVEFLDSHPEVDLVGCRAVVFKGAGEIVGLLPFAADHGGICARPWKSIPLPHPSWMGKLEWFHRHRYRMPEVLRAEDQELLLRASPDSRYACLDEILLGYRQGDFNLRKTLLARRTLLAAQLEIFKSRKEWRNALLALCSGLAKMGVDVGAGLPYCSKLYFARMSAPAPAKTVADLRQLLASDGS